MNIDIIVPAHNEQHRISATLAAYRRHCPAQGVRIVVALDDCTDRTWDLVQQQHDQDERVHAIAYPRLGKGGVLAESLRQSNADYIAFVDADGATPPEELLRLVDVAEQTGADIAIASRYHPAAVLPARRRRVRRAASWGFATAVRTLFGMPFRDTQCGAKVLRSSAARRIVPLVSSRDFVFDVDLLNVARLLGFSVAEVPTVWLDRSGSRVSLGREWLRMAASLVLLWARNRVVPVTLPTAEIVDIDTQPEGVPTARAA